MDRRLSKCLAGRYTWGMFTRGEIPAPTARFSVRTSWQMYPAEALAMAWLDDLHVRAITAMEVHATRLWQIRIRRAPDEHLFLIHEGRGEMETRSGMVRFGPGDVLYWSRGEDRFVQQDLSTPFRHTAIHLDAHVGNRPLGQFQRLPNRVHLGDAHAMFAYGAALCRVCALHPPAWRQEADALATCLLLAFLRDPTVVAASEPIASEQAARLQPAVELMRRTLDDPSSLSALARRCRMSQAHFRRMFHTVFGCSPRTYLAELRVDEARQRLLTTADSVEQIARSVGFSNGAAFSALFRRRTGTTPGAFRKGAASAPS